MPGRKLTFFIIFLVLPILAVIKAPPSYALPPGFTKVQLANSTSLTNPVVFRFAPNGDIYIGEQCGAIKILRNGSVLPTPVMQVNAECNGEQGLLGIELDPNFATNGYLYLSYTNNDGYSRLSRVTVKNDVADPATEKIFAKGDQVANPHHNANDLHIGPDGKLWWSVGDNVPNQYNAQTLSNIYGKVLRYNLDGSVPSDSPFLNVPGAIPNIYTLGMRNPFRFSFLPNNKAIVAETGQDLWEELDVQRSGSNYGWPFEEGTCGSCGYADPVYAYGHTPDDGAISAIAPYTGSTFPKKYNNAVFYGDYNRQGIEYVTFDSTFTTETSHNVFDNSEGAIADMREGPDGNLYYMDIYGENLTEIKATGPFAPTAVASANKTSGNAPLKVQFSSSGSTDAYNSALTYSWNFGDGSAASTSANPSHTYNNAGTYTATLTVKNNKNLTATSTVVITVGHTAPSPSISTPLSGATYNAGNTIAFSGTATDKQDGTLPASAFSWKIDFYQNGVLRPKYIDSDTEGPFYGPVTGTQTGSFTIPTDSGQIPNSFYRISLTTTDSFGLSTTVTRDIKPNTTSFTVQTNVAGLGYFVDGAWHTSTATINGVVGVQHGLMGMPTMQLGTTRYRFAGWSDGGALLHKITNTTSQTYTAMYDVVSASLPAPWQSADIGSPAIAGTSEYSATDGAYFLDGNGYDVWGQYDQSRYVYQPLNGDGQIIARVTNLSNAQGEWAKAGVVIKESTTAGSPYVNAFVTPGTSDVYPNDTPYNIPYFGVHMQYGYNSDQNGGTPAGYTLPNEWLKLTRVGNIFTSYYSSDGTNWVQFGKTSVAMNANATIGLFVTSHNIGALATASFDNVQVTNDNNPPQPLPAPWQNSDIGSPSLAGSSSYSSTNGTYTVNGSGSDIWGSTDQFQFAYQPLNGDGVVIAHVISQDNTDPWAKSGIMIKQSPTAGAPYDLLAVTPGNGYHQQDSFNSDNYGGTFMLPNAWVKMVRVGNTFSTYVSPDGTNWTFVHADTVSMNSNAVAGLFVCSHNSSALNTTTFDNVSVTATPTGPLPAGWSQTDVGTPQLAGSSSYNGGNGTFTVNGGGSDIWGTTDEFQYAYKSLSGDGSIVARVTSQTNSDPWAKSGVMLKQSTAAGSNYVLLATTPSNGTHLQYNFNTDQTGSATSSLPVWLKLTRTGGTVTAYQSVDGVSWTQVGSPVTITMTDPVTIGLFVNAHSGSQLNTTTFDNVTTTP
ncbi:MAG: PQQ-dependent sugar dehydrogenase [Candidatus Saccharimonadales bacterium]